MDIFGIKNLTNKELEFDYSKYFKKVGMDLNNAKTENDRNIIRRMSRENLDILLSNIEIDINILKDNFINLLLSENSSKYLWILYSKYKNEENYIDKLSDILKRENKVFRGGINIYKMNGWMAHSLYVYQIANYNIANNIEISNFDGNVENMKQVQELHKIYNSLSNEAKFLLKVFSLIHDIGVIEEVKSHDKLGVKYIESVLEEIGLNQNVLDKNNISIDIFDLIKILKELVKNHVLITSLSSEASDLYIENEYKNLLKAIPETTNVKNDIPKVLLLLAYGDVIAVNECLMDTLKYQRINDGYHFFNNISQGKNVERNKEKVVIEKICDMIGEKNPQNLILEFDKILDKYKINRTEFIEDMYNIKSMRYTLPIMKSLKNTEMTIKIYYELFKLISLREGKEELKNYTIIFVPEKPDSEFVEQFKNGNLFECIKNMNNSKENNCTYKNINILIGLDLDGKFLHIKVV